MQYKFLSRVDAAQRNLNNILHYVKKHGPISRTDIWNGMNISRASVTQLVQQLQESGLIVETGEGESTGGRKPRFIMFNGAARKMYAFDWSSHSLYLIDLDGEVLFEKALNFDTDIQPKAFAAMLLREIENIQAMELCAPQDVIGFALTLPGLIDSRHCSVVYSVELGWQNVNVQELFSESFDGHVYLERTGNMLALGEHVFGQAKKESHFQLFVLDASGIGVSTVVRGDCQHGMNYMHGELGHIKLPENVFCSCGQVGCLEAVVNDLLLRSGGAITNKILEYLAIGVSTAINISDVGEAILVGSFVNAMTLEQRRRLAAGIRAKVTRQQQRKLEIRFSQNTRQLALKGLSTYVFDRFFAVD